MIQACFLDSITDEQNTIKGLFRLLGRAIFFVFMAFLLVFTSCKKDQPETKLGKIDITDAYSLVLCHNDSIGAAAHDSLKLYKIISDDKLYYVRHYNQDGNFLGFTYQSVALYDLNKQYFLYVVSKGVSTSVETYLINKADGTAQEVRDFELPRINNGQWDVNQSNRVFVEANASNYYYVGNNSINSLSFDKANYPVAESKTAFNQNFDIDTLGNILTGGNLLYTNGTSQTITEIDENTIVSRNTKQGFYIIKTGVSDIQVSNIRITDFNYMVESKGIINESATNWKYLGNASFNNTNSIVLVYDLGLIYIDNTTQKIFPLSTFSLTRINSFSQSNTYLFVNGLNTLQNEVMLKINPQAGTPIFSHILVPERYHFYTYQVDENSNFSFYARDKVKSADVIGYLSSAQYVNILDNSQQLVPRQILSIK
jgi:hypothetical protein